MSRHSTYGRNSKGVPAGFFLLEPENGVFPKK